MTDWRDRIVEVKRMRVRDILAHERNPRLHPSGQKDVVRGLLGEVGKADVLRAYYSQDNGGRLTLWDGHLRQDLDPDQEWWVAITDLNDDEAAKMLVLFDPIAALAEQDAEKLEALLHEVNVGDAALQQMLASMAEDAGIVPPDNPYEHWQGMPEFEQKDKTAFQSIHIHFHDQEAIDTFAELIGQKITDRTRSLWYPAIEIERYSDKSYSDES